MNKKHSIRTQMVIMFFTVILPMFIASIMLILNMRSFAKEKSLESALSSADSVKYRIIDIIESAESSVEMMAVNNEIISFLDNDYTNRAEYYKFYSSNVHARYIRVSPQIRNIYIYVDREDFVFSANYHHANETIKETEWYRSAVNAPDKTFWNVIPDPDGEGQSLCCIKAVMAGGTAMGVAAAAINNEWIERFLPADQLKTVLAVNNGSVYYSSYNGISAGDKLEYEGDISVASIRKTYDYGFFDFYGYTVLNNFTNDFNFQIILLIPANYVNYEINRLSVVYGGYSALMIILSVLIVILFTSMFSRRIKLLSEKMHSVASGNFDVEFDDRGNDEIADLYTDLGQMIKSMQSMMNDIYQAKLQSEAFKFNQMEAEFKALSSQINPHFLYNTLETIRMKAYCNNDKETADLVKKLGKFMRRCLEFKDGEVTLRSELEFTNSYLELQSARFGDRVSYSIYSEVSKEYMILPLLIQPLVENAFVHGIEGSKSNGRIDIKVYYRDEFVIVDVSDNGCGITPERLAELEEKLSINDTSSGKSIGLTNVNKRIKMYHGKEYGMTIHTKQGEGTVIRITLPRKPKSKIEMK